MHLTGEHTVLASVGGSVGGQAYYEASSVPGLLSWGRDIRTTIDLDDEKVAAAARELGTTSKVETVNAALAYVAARRQRAEAFDDPLIWGSPDLADPEILVQARR
jgi:Arc/MetJ family transcription regulator